MGKNTHSTHPTQTMGIIADRLKARLTEMQARHEQTNRELEQARQETEEALRALIKSTDKLLDQF